MLIGIIVSSILLAISLLILIIFLVKKNKNKIVIDDDFIQKLANSLGGIENILDVKNENGRVKFELGDLELANFEDVKAFASKGVFVTNNTVKMLFTYDSDIIVKAFKNIK